MLQACVALPGNCIAKSDIAINDFCVHVYGHMCIFLSTSVYLYKSVFVIQKQFTNCSVELSIQNGLDDLCVSYISIARKLLSVVINFVISTHQRG